MTGNNTPLMNENALSNVLVDVDFLEEEFKRNGRPQLMNAFGELRDVRIHLSVILSLFPSLPFP